MQRGISVSAWLCWTCSLSSRDREGGAIVTCLISASLMASLRCKASSSCNSFLMFLAFAVRFNRIYASSSDIGSTSGSPGLLQIQGGMLATLYKLCHRTATSTPKVSVLGCTGATLRCQCQNSSLHDDSSFNGTVPCDADAQTFSSRSSLPLMRGVDPG